MRRCVNRWIENPSYHVNDQKLCPIERLLDAGEPQSAVARLLNVDQSTISRLVQKSAA